MRKILLGLLLLLALPIVAADNDTNMTYHCICNYTVNLVTENISSTLANCIDDKRKLIEEKDLLIINKEKCDKCETDYETCSDNEKQYKADYESCSRNFNNCDSDLTEQKQSSAQNGMIMLGAGAFAAWAFIKWQESMKYPRVKGLGSRSAGPKKLEEEEE